MFSKNELAQKGSFLDKTKAEREKRMQDKQRDVSATKIQVSQTNREEEDILTLILFFLSWKFMFDLLEGQ